MDNYNYPPGADTPDAPWNQREPEDIEVVCEMTVLMRNDVVITTDDYSVEIDEEDGMRSYDLNISYKDAERLYREQHHTIKEMLNELYKYIKAELAEEGITKTRKWELQAMLEDCKGWREENIEIEDFHKR